MPTTWYLKGHDGYNATGDGTTWAQARQRLNDATPTNYSGYGAGDTIRVAKSPAPYSIGNATWTPVSSSSSSDANRRVTLSSAVTLNIDLCESGWVSNGTECVCTHDADERQGTYAVKLTKATAFSNLTLIAYKDLGAGGIDFSGYQRISFWIKNSVALVDTNWVIKLCSDQAGATPVDEFPLCNAEVTAGEGTKNPPIPSTTRYVPLTILKSGGGNLGSAIKSVAIYSGAAGMAAGNILIDNIIACTTTGLNLQSLISPQSTQQAGAEQWYCIRFINDTVIELDTDTNSAAGSGRGFVTLTSTDYGSGAVATYARETIKPYGTDVSGYLAMATATTTAIQQAYDGSGYTDWINFEGGYTADSNQDGETFYDGLNGWGYGLTGSGFRSSYNYINFVRYYIGINSSQNRPQRHKHTRVGHCTTVGCSLIGEPLIVESGNKIITYNNITIGHAAYMSLIDGSLISIGNMSYNFSLSSSISKFNEIISKGSNTRGLNSGAYSIHINKLTSAYNNTDFIITNGRTSINQLTLTGDTTGNYSNTSGGGMASCDNYGGSATDKRMWGKDWSATYQNSVAVSGYAWSFYIQIATAGFLQSSPIIVPIAKVAVAASADVTITAQLRHNSTDAKAKLCVRGYQLPGIDANVYSDLLDSDTVDTWVTKTLTLSGTSQPDVAGVVEVELHMWSLSTNKYIYIDDFTVTQS